jgi:hypothetical protein
MNDYYKILGVSKTIKNKQAAFISKLKEADKKGEIIQNKAFVDKDKFGGNNVSSYGNPNTGISLGPLFGFLFLAGLVVLIIYLVRKNGRR